MKRLMIACSVLVVIAVIAVSCTKRDYICTCNYTDRYGGYITDVSTVKGSMKAARNACNAHGSNLKAYVMSGDVPCYVK